MIVPRSEIVQKRTKIDISTRITKAPAIIRGGAIDIPWIENARFAVAGVRIPFLHVTRIIHYCDYAEARVIQRV